MFLKTKHTALAVCLLLLAFTSPNENKIRVWMIGDSTMSDYHPARGPITGWGTPFKVFFDSTVQVENRARGGRSTRTFISEQRWQPIADSLAPGDYVLIQFGHNDEAKEPQYADRYTPLADYIINLTKFISETRAKKAKPVLITPVSRMRFDSAGNTVATHTEYTRAVITVGKKLNVPVIDLDSLSRGLYQHLGPEKTSLLFLQYKPGQEPLYPNGVNDHTHFNEWGARQIAQLVLHNLHKQHIPLANRVKNKPHED